MRYLFILSTVALLFLPRDAPAQASYQQPNPSGYGDPTTLVNSWYQKYLGRTAQTDRNSYGWVNQLAQGASPESVLAGILSSDEYFNRGPATPEGFIGDLYRDVLGRQPTPGQFQYWTQRAFVQNIQDPQTRKDIAYDFLTHHPGSWQVASNPAPTVPTNPYPYDYRRPYYPYRH